MMNTLHSILKARTDSHFIRAQDPTPEACKEHNHIIPIKQYQTANAKKQTPSNISHLTEQKAITINFKGRTSKQTFPPLSLHLLFQLTHTSSRTRHNHTRTPLSSTTNRNRRTRTPPNNIHPSIHRHARRPATRLRRVPRARIRICALIETLSQGHDAGLWVCAGSAVALRSVHDAHVVGVVTLLCAFLE